MNTTPAIQEGATKLKELLSAWGPFFEQVRPRHDEVLTFELRLPADYLNCKRSLRIAFLSDFPINPPRLTVFPPPWLTWPHADERGRLCLFGFGFPPSAGSATQVVIESIQQFKKLLKIVLPNTNTAERKKEFHREIISYWTLQLPRKTIGKALLLNRPEESCPLFMLTVPKHFLSTISQQNIFSNNLTDLQKFYNSVAGYTPNFRAPSDIGYYFRLESIPSLKLPEPYNFLDWLLPCISGSAHAELSSWHKEHATIPERWFFLDIPGVNPAQIVGIWIGPTRLKGEYFAGLRDKRRAGATAGVSQKFKLSFRNISSHLLTHDKIHSRDTAAAQHKLNEKTILMAGLGSLGSFIAQILVKAGIGKLILVDPDNFCDANIGRHILGIEALGRSKVHALRDFFIQNTPNVEILPIQKHIEFAYNSCDLSCVDSIIVTAASWGAESFLWEQKKHGVAWSLLQAWTEPYVIAGHAIYAPQNGKYSATNLFTPNGEYKNKFTTWEDNGYIPLPACGEGFISGGPISINSIATMVASIAIKSITGQLHSEPKMYSWIGDISLIPQLKGIYTGPPVAPNHVQTIIEHDWPLNAPL